MANKSDWNGHGSWSKMMDAKIKKEKANAQARNSAYVIKANNSGKK